MTESSGVLHVRIEGKLSFWENFVYGLQHMFLIGMSAVITPMIFFGAFAQAGPLALTFDQVAYLVGAMFIGAGLITLTQSAFLLRLPVAQGQNIIIIVLMISTVYAYGWGVTFAGLLFAGILATLCTLPFSKGIIGWLAKSITPAPVYGTLILLIGITMAPQVALGSMIIPTGQPIDGISVVLALISFLIPLLLMLFIKKGFLRNAAVVIGLVVAVIVAIIIGRVDFSGVATAQWITVPQVFPLGFTFDIGPVAIVTLIMFIGYLATIAEAVGVYHVTAEMDGQKLTNTRVNKGIFGETLGSTITSIFGSVPTTSYAQNLGLIAMTGVGARSVMTSCAILLIILGFIYKLGAIAAAIPMAIYGGTLLSVLAMLIAVGISSIAKMEWNDLNMAIVGTGCAVGIGALAWQGQIAALNLHPIWGIFLGNPALLGFLVAWILHSIFVLPKNKATVSGAAVSAKTA
ncbi:MAG: solute carrier family 23 protein [bacterium]